MEVAEQIVLMDEGRIQQIGGPRDLYDSPANEFVMSFIGPVTRVGDTYARPHDFEILRAPRMAQRRRRSHASITSASRCASSSS